MPQAGFEPVQNLSSGFIEWSCAVVHYVFIYLFIHYLFYYLLFIYFIYYLFIHWMKLYSSALFIHIISCLFLTSISWHFLKYSSHRYTLLYPFQMTNPQLQWVFLPCTFFQVLLLPLNTDIFIVPVWAKMTAPVSYFLKIHFWTVTCQRLLFSPHKHNFSNLCINRLNALN